MTDGVVDTNIVLVVLNPADPRHTAIVASLARLRADYRLIVPPQAWYECYVVLTRPTNVNGYGRSPSDAYFDIDAARLQFDTLPDPPDLLDEWLGLCRTHAVSGKNAHDARLAAYALRHGAPTLLTLNPRDFARYGLSVIVP